MGGEGDTHGVRSVAAVVVFLVVVVGVGVVGGVVVGGTWRVSLGRWGEGK